MKPRPLTLSQWKNRHAPMWKDHHIEAAWLREHWTYGGRIHEETASALVTALGKPSTRPIGHRLYLKLFAEYANALEVAGAWGWVLRTRRAHPLLLDAFLTYPYDAPRAFYLAARRNRSGSLVRLLNLPSEAKVVAALSAAIPDWTTDHCRQSLTDAVKQAKWLAARYFDNDEVIRAAYNRTKHGATMLHDESLPDREFWVVGPHLQLASPTDGRRYQMPKFTVDTRMIRSAIRSVEVAGSMIRYLAGLARAMDEAGLLYPRGRPTP